MEKNSFNEIKNNNSEFLLKAAWLLEIFFFTTGIIIAVTLSLNGLGSENQSFNKNLVIISGFLPLFAIACLELTKIPIMQFILLAKSFFAKMFMGALLIFFMILTFENMVAGLEQNFKNNEYEIKQTRLDVKKLNQDLDLLEDEILILENLDPKKIRSSSMIEIKPSLDLIELEIGNLKEREVELKNAQQSLEGRQILRQIANLELAKKEEAKNYNLEISRLNNEILNLNKDEQNQLSQIIFGKRSVMESFQKRRNQINSEIETIKSEYVKSKNKIDEQIISLNKDVKRLSSLDKGTLSDLEEISFQILSLQKEKTKLLENVNREVDLKLAAFNDVDLKLQNLVNKRTSIKDNLSDSKNRLAQISEDNFIHTLAARFYGAESAADLNEKQIQIFTLITMFTIAFMCSIAGPAFAYAAMKSKIEISQTKQKKKPITKSFRKLLISLRKRINSPIKEFVEKEVEKIIIETKEIPVEKKVFEKIEIPTPYEVTRFVGIPVPTDPKDLPNEVDKTNLFDKEENNMELVK